MPKITINGISLEPEAAQPQLEARGLAAEDASASNFILVQVEEPLSKDQKDALKQSGVELREFVPENTYIARFEGTDLSEVRGLPFVTWVNTYMKGFKISTELMETGLRGPIDLMAATEAVPLSDEMREVDVVFHAGVHGEEIKEAVARAAGLDPEALDVSRHKIRARVQASRLSAVADIDEVRHIEEVHEPTLFNDVALTILRADVVHAAQPGFRGTGQVVAVCDTGFDLGSTTDVHGSFGNRVKRLYPLGRTNADDPHGHGTHVAGSVLCEGTVQDYGTISGAAPAASLVLQSVLDAGGGLGGLPSDLNSLFRDPYDNDEARVHNNSWGTRNTNGSYTSSSRELDDFVWNNRDMVICFAAGNPGRDGDGNGVIDSGSVQAPSTAKNCITVGACESNRPDQSKPWAVGSWAFRYPVDPIASDLWADDPEGMAAFSGRGPTRDGRIKPDVVAPGTSILSAHSRRANVSDFWGLSPDRDFCYMGGTSMATPLVAGCCAVVREYLIGARGLDQPSAALVKAMLINGAVDIQGQYVPSEAGAVPNFAEGFGRVDLARTLAVDEDRTVEVFDEERELDVGEEQLVSVEFPDERTLLKVTLVWSDPPGESLQNDLDLIVRTADGLEFHGNRPPGSLDFDRTNNVEQVQVASTPTGTTEVLVRAHRIALHPQSFALVIRME